MRQDPGGAWLPGREAVRRTVAETRAGTGRSHSFVRTCLSQCVRREATGGLRAEKWPDLILLSKGSLKVPVENRFSVCVRRWGYGSKRGSREDSPEATAISQVRWALPKGPFDEVRAARLLGVLSPGSHKLSHLQEVSSFLG